MVEITPIGIVHSCFKEKFGIPRQPGLAPSTRGHIVMLPPFDQEEAFLGLEGVSHIWLQFVFHQNPQQRAWHAKVRPPRLGGNSSMGVFATRSPFRPNGLGLSVVRYLGYRREQGQLHISIAGLDLLDQTPVVDIKPYVPYADHVPEATNAFAEGAPDFVPVRFSDEAESACTRLSLQGHTDWHRLVVEVLQQDPRPAYHQSQAGRVYGCRLYNQNVRWEMVEEQGVLVARVTDIKSTDI